MGSVRSAKEHANRSWKDGGCTTKEVSRPYSHELKPSEYPSTFTCILCKEELHGSNAVKEHMQQHFRALLAQRRTGDACGAGPTTNACEHKAKDKADVESMRGGALQPRDLLVEHLPGGVHESTNARSRHGTNAQERSIDDGVGVTAIPTSVSTNEQIEHANARHGSAVMTKASWKAKWGREAADDKQKKLTDGFFKKAVVSTIAEHKNVS